jgi:Fe-S oxidoreductase
MNRPILRGQQAFLGQDADRPDLSTLRVRELRAVRGFDRRVHALERPLQRERGRVVAVDPGCWGQLRPGLRRRKSKVRVVHIADLLRLAARDR